MFKSLVCYLFIFTLLFTGIESAVDSAAGELHRGESYAHILDSDFSYGFTSNVEVDSTVTDPLNQEDSCGSFLHCHNHGCHCYLTENFMQLGVTNTKLLQPDYRSNLPIAPVFSLFRPPIA